MTGRVSPNLAGAETVQSVKFHRGSRDLGAAVPNPGLKRKKACVFVVFRYSFVFVFIFHIFFVFFCVI